ncbi:terminase [Mycolicibacterium septicum]|uniref:terminase n=1 Tax=Mycolicibacterium septicum TaxID=98668 RepID=UPI001AFA288A|nr:terminase [Mycolicibacterium septicum]QRY51738.1 terminase [Mycolicibacterium septicum]
MTLPTSDASELPPGYWIDERTGAWCTIPWPSDPDEKRHLIENSLGPLVIRWAENKLTDEEFEQFGPGLIHPLTGKSWEFTPGQKRFLILYYAYNPENGRYLYRRAIKRGSKGVGKDPAAAAHGNIELAGPSQLVWDDDFGWHGVPHRMPLCQIASNSEAQSKDTLRIACAMWSKEARAWHGLECGETRILKGQGRFEVLTSSESSSEGDPASFIILNESHHMTATNGGHRMAAVARRNVGKSPADLQARIVEYTNAHSMGIDSEGERSYIGWQQQVSGQFSNLKKDILYDSIEANPNLDITKPDELAIALIQAYSDAPWADLERLADEVMDPQLSLADAIRFYLNGLALREDAWVDPTGWKRLSRKDTSVEEGERISMFLDCSKSSDATGLVGVRISDGFTFTLGIWQPEKGGRRDKAWLAPRENVDAEVRAAFDRYKVMWFGVDPSPATDDETEALYWADYIDSWHRDFGKKLPLWATPGASTGHSVKFDMRTSQRGAFERLKQFTEQAELCARWIDEESGPDNPNPQLTHDGDPALTLHVHNARARANQWGVTLGKESKNSKKLVDLAVCMVGAHLGRRLVLNNTKLRNGPQKPRRVVTNW